MSEPKESKTPAPKRAAVRQPNTTTAVKPTTVGPEYLVDVRQGIHNPGKLEIYLNEKSKEGWSLHTKEGPQCIFVRVQQEG